MTLATTIEIKEAAGLETIRQAARYAHPCPKHKQSEAEDRRHYDQIRRSQYVAGVTTPNMHQPSNGKNGAKWNGGNRTA